ncbi:NADH-ubiquinone oxidoreductase-F iron-sulfur binding region domain-containing protein [Anaeromicropila herbilytica]|uniref:4Fe-4S ferredoxin-type domain-containing protein n=1 Tax=Anaeromicropila herbilytica TaxID=2785025 RepID=A0A7R7IE71_9FIRM|nr:NADH-ubiquinone oxidoreductase-F iron-sulfur binding region domain-containing protein [Anaeromicropila herbilytica]BCN31804.1 hypothetical protein bsdtb5_30990 [Anaeromicropila herbilytica]
MLLENSTLCGHGLKGHSIRNRWNNKEWNELACLFIEDEKQSENVRYLLERYQKEICNGIIICKKELHINTIKIYISDCYKEYVGQLKEQIKQQLGELGYEIIVVTNKKHFEKEVFQELTLVHHAETMLALSRSLNKDDIPHKVITISGDVKNPGIYEIPYGITLRQIIDEYGKGIKSDKEIKFVQVGGNTGAVFTEEELDTTFEYENLMGYGTMIETAKIEVFPSDTCIVQWAVDKMLYNSKETCGKCVYCREGIYQLYKIMKDATEGKGRDGDIELSIELSETMKTGTLCDFGKSASNPLYTSLHKFRDEFDKHIDRKVCATLSCLAYANLYIDPNACDGCGACMDCPEKAIKGGEKLIHVIDVKACEKCGRCEAICSKKAVKRYGSIKPQLPTEPVEVGSFAAGGLDEKKGLGLGRRRRKSE